MAPQVVAEGTEPTTLGDEACKVQATFTAQEVAKHNKSSDCYMIIRDKVLDVTRFAAHHPGGEAILMTYAGQDATDVFAIFHPPFAYKMLSDFTIGELSAEERNKHSDFVNEIRRLRGTFKELGYFKGSKPYYAFKVLSNLAILTASVYCASFNTLLSAFVGGCLLALFWQQCGWLAHDFLHHQVFDSRSLNNLTGYIIGDLFQGFSVDWWKKKHNQHHAVPNVHGQDPDIDTMPFLAWSDYALEGFSDPAVRDKMPKFFVDHQQYFLVPLFTVARLSWAIASLLWVRDHPKCRNRYTELTMLSGHWLALFLIMALTMSPVQASVYFVTSQIVCGLLLASVFSLNHNGMPVLKPEDAKKMDFYTLQIITGRDVNPSVFNSWFSGGLCFQIEHHLFPMLPRHNFHKVQPLVESLCKKYNIVYHKTSFIDGMIEVFRCLGTIGAASQKLY